MKKLIIAGDRNYNNYEFVEKNIFLFLKENNIKLDKVEIVSGCATGVDALGEMFSKKYNLTLHRYPANWKDLGLKAGPIRNEEMAKVATHLIAFWNYESKGTKNMINNSKKYNLITKVCDIRNE